MDLYQVALAVLLKKPLQPYVNDMNRKHLISDCEHAIELAKLFMQAVDADKAKSQAPIIVGLPEEVL